MLQTSFADVAQRLAAGDEHPASGSLRVVRLIHEGSLSQLWEVVDERTAERFVLKLSDHPELPEAHTLRLIARIEPRLEVLAAGTTRRGQTFVALRFWQGRSLDVVLRDGALDDTTALRVMRAVTRMLAHLHASGVVHRDIKPANIFVPEQDGRSAWDECFLFDFQLRGELDHDTRKTGAGAFFGTPVYMSPEQLRAEPQSAATDVYLLGLVLWEMATGARAWLPSDANVASVLSVLATGLPEPSAAIEPRLRDLIRRCTRRDPRERPADGAQLLLLLDQAPSSLPAAGQVPTPGGGRHPGSGSIGHPWSGTMGQPAATSAGAAFAIDPSPPRPRSAMRLVALAVGAGALLVTGSCMTWAFIAHPASSVPSGTTLSAAGWLVVSIAFPSLLVGGALAYQRWAASREPVHAKRAFALMAGRDRHMLTESIAIQTDKLLQDCASIDGLLATSVALMLAEYREAADGGNRRDALMKLMELAGKLRERLTPWYVRHDKLISLAMAVVGLAFGALGAAKTYAELTTPEDHAPTAPVAAPSRETAPEP